MADKLTESATPSIDEWVAELGEEQLAAAVRSAIEEVESGRLPGFTDKASLLDYLGRRATR